MTVDEFKKLDFLERLKVQNICIDIATAYSLYEHAKAQKETELFFNAFIGAISKERTSDKNDIYAQYFNELNVKAYTKQKGQSIGGQKSKRTTAKPKANKDAVNMDLK